MSIFADLLSTIFERRNLPEPEPTQDGRSLIELATDLVSSSGEIKGAALASEILTRFPALDDSQKLTLFRFIAAEMDIDPESVSAAAATYAATPSRATYKAYMLAAEPRRQELIRRLNRVPGATNALVQMRAELLKLGRGDPQLEALDLDFSHLFASWFNRGFLVLRPINWESPAHILEKIIAYEAVHAIGSWDDLRRRLQPRDRRCFAFFHPSMPDEPLIFVEVALTSGIATSIQDLLSDERVELAESAIDTAIFYSISNCQPGLANISFGNSLIKQVAADLAAELSQLTTFATLSPIPSLVRWMDTNHIPWEPGNRALMAQIAAHYLLHAKRPDGLPLDPVARFHLGNGAIIHDLHGGADLSDKGLAQSGSAMVNYLYDLDLAAENHEQFVTNNHVAASAKVQELASGSSLMNSRDN